MDSVIAGRNNVRAALAAGRPINKLLVAKGSKGLKSLLALAREQGCPVQFVPRERVDEAAAGLNHQGVVAMAAAWQYWDLADLLAAVEIRDNPTILVLAGIEDPHNLGALLRTADCAGVAGIVVPKRRSAQLTGTVARVSMGAVETVRVARVTNLAAALAQLKEAGFWVAVADMDGKPYWQLRWDFPVALVLGGEGKGVPRLLREKADYLVSIPLQGKISSLNVSAAGAVLAYEILRQRSIGYGAPYR